MWSPHFWGIAHVDVEAELQNWKQGLPQNSARIDGKISPQRTSCIRKELFFFCFVCFFRLVIKTGKDKSFAGRRVAYRGVTSFYSLC